jgi:hypothetical protein
MKALKNSYELKEEDDLIKKMHDKHQGKLAEIIERNFLLLQEAEEFYLDKRAVAINICYS